MAMIKLFFLMLLPWTLYVIAIKPIPNETTPRKSDPARAMMYKSEIISDELSLILMA